MIVTAGQAGWSAQGRDSWRGARDKRMNLNSAVEQQRHEDAKAGNQGMHGTSPKSEAFTWQVNPNHPANLPLPGFFFASSRLCCSHPFAGFRMNPPDEIATRDTGWHQRRRRSSSAPSGSGTIVRWRSGLMIQPRAGLSSPSIGRSLLDRLRQYLLTYCSSG
jgi:hypothetical protein